MKTFLSGLFRYHLVPVIAAVVVLIGIDTLYADTFSKVRQPAETITVKGEASYTRSALSNCETTRAEIELIASLGNHDKLTIMGSSEIQNVPYAPYYFLPDSAGIPTTAFGHAYHQNLSIACELLAAGDQLEGANVCILLSPGWFESGGTNIEAFLEFVRPNFLRRIIHDQSIPEKEKMRIARYVYNHFDEINHPSAELIFFKEMYLRNKLGGYPQSLKSPVSMIKKVRYEITPAYDVRSVRVDTSLDFGKIKARLDSTFLSACKNNSMYVDSSYYATYLVRDGEYRPGKMKPVRDREELEDFFMVADILKRYNCKATFVLQPLNPFHYKGLDHLEWIRQEITEKLKSCNFPFLDLYVTDPDDYKVLFLQDIMHPGNRGWMEVNEFLIENYKHVQK